MKTAMTALAVVLLAGMAAPALAQPAGGDRMRDRAERLESRDRPQRDGASRDFGGERRRDSGEAPRAREAPQAPAAPPAPAASEPRRGGDGVRDVRGSGRGDGVRGDGRDGRRGDGDRNNDGRRDWSGRGDNDHRGDRRGNDRRDWDRRGDNDRRDWNGRDNRRDWDRRGDHRRWERGRYPSVYFSSHRYRYAWRPPSGFYVRSWAYGEFLPRSWFGPSYWIADPWQFDLPLPPPGFGWVRSGDDALLVDEYTGRIVQVVRNVFW